MPVTIRSMKMRGKTVYTRHVASKVTTERDVLHFYEHQAENSGTRKTLPFIIQSILRVVQEVVDTPRTAGLSKQKLDLYNEARSSDHKPINTRKKRVVLKKQLFRIKRASKNQKRMLS